MKDYQKPQEVSKRVPLKHVTCLTTALTYNMDGTVDSILFHPRLQFPFQKFE